MRLKCSLSHCLLIRKNGGNHLFGGLKMLEKLNDEDQHYEDH